MKNTQKPSRIHHGKAGSGKDTVRHSNDQHIDQDFPGYPAATAQENVISPKTREDGKIAGSDKIAKK